MGDTFLLSALIFLLRFSSKALAVLFHWVNVVITLHGFLLPECLISEELVIFLWQLMGHPDWLLLYPKMCWGRGCLPLWGRRQCARSGPASPDQELERCSHLSWLPGFLESGLLSIYSNCSFRLVHCLKLFDDHHLSLIKRKVQNTRYTSFHSVSVFLAVAMCGEIVSILLKFLLTLWDSVSSSKILLLEEIISLILIISGIPYTELPIQEKRQTWRKL